MPILPGTSQVLEGRTSRSQQDRITQALEAGRLPPADTWPQEVVAPEPGSSSDVEAGLDLTLSPTVFGRLGTDEFWTSPLFQVSRKVNVADGIGWAGTPGAWGAQFGTEVYADHADQGWGPTNVVIPEAETANAFPAERHFLTQGWLWYDFHPLQLEIGRDRVHWGPLDRSLIVADSLPFLDMVRASIETPRWSLEWIVATPETRRGGTSSDVEVAKVLNLHRIEYRADTWRLGFTENYTVARPGPVVLADLFPVMVEHQADLNPNNECVALDFEWVPAPHWRLMGQFGLDDVQATTFGIPDDGVPTIPAFQCGAEWRGPWRAGTLTLHLEGGHTHYLWGNFQDPEGKAEYLLVQNDHADVLPLTSPYGPGATWLEATGRWTKNRTVIQARVEAFTVVPGVSLDLPYRADSRYAGVGASLNDRMSLSVEWPLTASWTLEVEEYRELHAGLSTYGGRITLAKQWSTRDPGSARLSL